MLGAELDGGPYSLKITEGKTSVCPDWETYAKSDGLWILSSGLPCKSWRGGIRSRLGLLHTRREQLVNNTTAYFVLAKKSTRISVG